MADEEKYVDRTDIVIENHTATWDLKAEGAINGTYMGTFKFKCYLTPSETIAAGRERRSLLGDNAILATQKESFYAYALPQLKYRVISGPPFWEAKTGQYSGDIADAEVMGMILDAALGAELKFNNEIKKRKTDAIERAKKAAEQMLSKQKVKSDDGPPEESSDLP